MGGYTATRSLSALQFVLSSLPLLSVFSFADVLLAYSQVAKSMVNTAVCPAGGGIVVMLLHWCHHRR